MRGEPQPAWVLHRRPWRETSLLVELLTLEGGRVGCVVRGVRGPRGQPLRAALQPLQPLTVVLDGRGELARLVAAEVFDAALGLRERALLAAFYVNELCLRLLPRQEPQPALFWRYGACLNALAGGAPSGWTLRCFERDLLAALGYGLRLDFDADGGALEPEQHYRYDPERGARRTPGPVAGSVCGASLLALGGAEAPAAGVLAELRFLMRRLLQHHLGRELESWRVLGELEAGVAPATTHRVP